MDTNVAVPVRFTLGRQSSLAPEDRDNGLGVNDDELEVLEDIDPTFQLMYLANEGDIEGMSEILDAFGNNVNFKDVDGRTPLHVAACQGLTDVVELLLQRGAEVDPKDRWGSTPLADAIYYKNHNVIKLLEENGAKPLMAPMHVLHAREVPEYEIHSNELDFTNSVYITKGTFRIASWRGIQVAVKELPEDVVTDEIKVRAFSDELSLLQKIRHPNVVQFLGAVTQSSPMMIVTEYLPKGDLRAFLKRKGALKPATAVKFALDIARGMNYLHEHTPGAIVHCDLEPSYVAPEVYRNEEYDMKVDVFSFALILQEMIEGCPPFLAKQDNEVADAYVEKQRPPFKASAKLYSHGLRELIEECWNERPAKRPTFRQIIKKLDAIAKHLGHKRHWKGKPMKCFHLEAIWRRDHSDSSSHSSSSSSTTH